MKKEIFLSLFIAAILSGVVLWRADFSPRKIQIPLLSERDIRSSEEFAWPLKFRYLNQGAQIFAFESEDGEVVLKFFNRDLLEIPRFASEKKKVRLRNRIQIYPESYRLAFEKLPTATGLLVVHQGISDEKYPIVEVVDKASRTFSIDLNHVPFVLQKKGSGTLISRLRDSGDSLENFIDQFLSFHAKRIRFCIADGDRDIKRNYSWIGNELVYIDPARFFYEPELNGNPERIRLEWWKATYRFRQWLIRNAPEEVGRFDAKVVEYKSSSGLLKPGPSGPGS